MQHAFTTGIISLFEKHRNPERAVGMKAYMRDQFDYIGIDAPKRRALIRSYFSKNQLPAKEDLDRIVKELWKLPERDYQYVAVELAMKYKKSWSKNDIRLFEYMVLQKSWWDTVDYISNKLIGPWLLNHPDEIPKITGKWNRDRNIWLQRLSLIFQLTYGKSTDKELLEKHILTLNDSKEFFVQKAIGWSLRQYSKFNPKWVFAFVKNQPLATLSKREALKVMERKRLQK